MQQNPEFLVTIPINDGQMKVWCIEKNGRFSFSKHSLILYVIKASDTAFYINQVDKLYQTVTNSASLIRLSPRKKKRKLCCIR